MSTTQAITKQFRAFHGNPDLKAKLLIEVEKHRAADQIVKGRYGDPREFGAFRGCAVGCSIHSLNRINGTAIDTANHCGLAEALDIPVTLFRLQDGIFEGLPQAKAMLWPGRFYEAIQPGANLEMVWPKFAHWLLIDPENGVLRHAKKERTKNAITDVAALYQRWIEGSKPTEAEWRAAADAYADAAAAYADAAAAYAADAYAAAADAYAAAADAYADAAAAYAADAYAAAAAAAADAADAYAAAAAAAADAAAAAAAYAADAYAADAHQKARIAQSEELLRLMALEPAAEGGAL